MFARRSIIILFALTLLIEFQSKAQESAIGKEFWISYLTRDIDPVSPHILRITFSVVDEDDIGNVRISGAGIQREYEDLKFNGSILYELDTGLVNEIMELNEGKDRLAIHIESDVDLMVYASNHTERDKQRDAETDPALKQRDDGDATMILPVELLGTHYYGISHNEDGNNYNSELVVVATENDTWIDILPSADTKFNFANTTFSINLDAGERYQIQSKGDLTGTVITLNEEKNTSCKPFAVFAGSKTSTIGASTVSGHMYNQMLPLPILGRNYSIVPFEELGNEYLIKLVSTEDNNEIRSNGQVIGTIEKVGGYMALDYDDLRYIQATKPIQLAQFFTGFKNKLGRKVDPFMTVISADEHMISSGTIPKTSFLGLTGIITGREFQNVLFFKNELAQYTHGSQEFGPNVKEFTPNPEIAYSNFYADQSLIQSGNRGFAYYRFNFGKELNVANLAVTINTGFTRLDTLSIDVPDSVCLNAEFMLTSVFSGKDGINPKFDIFEWDFGDGNKALGDGVYHQYDEKGKYEVRLIASSEGGICSKSDTAYRTISVLDFNLKGVQGAASVCPFTNDVEYVVNGVEGSTYSWMVSGGEITSAVDDKVLVDWKGVNTESYVRVVSMNPYCENDTLTYPVEVTSQLEPIAPFGPEEICLDQLVQTYSAGSVGGATYEWEVENGKILSGEGTDEVKIQWDGSATGRVWFRESNGTGDSFCTGVSDVLEVNFFSPIIVETTVQNVNCYEESTGAIELKVTGGNRPYTYSWTDMTDTGPVISTLVAGTYQVKITDNNGCVVTEVIHITEPEELTLGLELENVRCNGTSTGMASAIVSGGTLPYRFFWDNVEGNQTNAQLGVGTHHLRILDSQGCEVGTSFELTEPEPLFATTTDEPTCPGDDSGTIFVEASGGTPPYTYRWNTSPPQDSQLIQGLPAGNYSVTVTDRNGCTFTFDDKEISERYPHVQMPNVFSPNDDGKNDSFKAVSECSSTFQMKVFNQWGEIVFYSNDIDKGWDGMLRGQELPGGQYVYLISYWAEVNGQPFSEVVRGTVRLLR